VQAQLQVGRPDDPAEREADLASEQVAAGGSAPLVRPGRAGFLRREDFKPWPGQVGTDVAGTLTQKGTVTSERVQRTGAPNYAQPKPILLELDSSACTLTSTMEINFIQPSDKSRQLPADKFTELKNKVISVANEKLNGWVEIHVADDKKCTTCSGKTIKVHVVAREGSSPDADTVELRKGGARADAGAIYEESSLGTVWHEAGHIVLGLPDEYTALPGDPPRPADKTNEDDWSVMATHHVFGRRASLLPRHFNFMSAWLGRKFPGCTFEVVSLPKPIVVDVVGGLSITGMSFAGGPGMGVGADLAAGFALTSDRRLRLLLGGYANMLSKLDTPPILAFTTGALIGLDYSTNRSSGGFGIRTDFRAGGAALVSGPEPLSGKFVPEIGGSLTIGYQGPTFEIGATGSVGKLFPNADQYIQNLPDNNRDKATLRAIQDDPYFIIGIRAGLTL
jgi:hypothetical protein